MNITIKNTEIQLVNKMRALLIYEQITDKAFNPTTITDMMLYFYCVVLANKPYIELTFDEFMDILDEQPQLFSEFNKWVLNLNKMNGQYNDNTDEVKKNLS